MKLKTKNSGVSFAIGIIVSTILLSVGLTVFESVNRIAKQGYDLENKNKLFYQNETGLEAALYHHNKLGGKGLDFGDTPTQSIDLGNGNTVDWTIIGREKTDQSGKKVLTGILKESESIEIPFYYDSRTNPTASESIVQIAENFSLDFSRFEFNTDGTESGTEIIPEIGPNPGEFNFLDNDNSPVLRNNVLISWAITRKIDSGPKEGVIQTFVPRSDDPDGVLCLNTLGDPNPNPASSFLCEVHLMAPSNIDISINSANAVSADAVIGYILPGQTPTTLSDFWDGNDVAGTVSNKKLSFRPLAFFHDDTIKSKKIKGIPWKLTIYDDPSSVELPTPTFTIKTRAIFNGGKFVREESVTLSEKTAISSFDNFNAE